MDKKRYVPLFAIISFSLGAVCLVIRIIYSANPSFADFINKYPGSALRFILSVISGIFPFSLMEFLLFISPILAIYLIVIIIRYTRKSKKHLSRGLCYVGACGVLIFSLYTIAFAPGYNTPTLFDKMELERADISADELYETELMVIDKVNELAKNVTFSANGDSPRPYDFNEMTDKLNDAYKKADGKYGFLYNFKSKLKPLIISPLMTYTHLSGIYSFFTGESNINTNYPDFVVVYTAAHELAHQRGISREDEANFTAFLVCSESDDEYIRYCAYLNMYEYLSDALYEADPEMYFMAEKYLSQNVRSELSAYSRFFDKYRDNAAADVADTVNDAYLKSHGTEGVRSYGMVVDIAVAYFKEYK